MTQEERDRINELISEVKELTRTLRGFNGTPGLVTEFALLRHQVTSTVEEIKRINEKGCNHHLQEGLDSPEKKEVKEAKKDNESNDNVTFKWFREKLLVPLILTFVISAIQMLFK